MPQRYRQLAVMHTDETSEDPHLRLHHTQPMTITSNKGLSAHQRKTHWCFSACHHDNFYYWREKLRMSTGQGNHGSPNRGGGCRAAQAKGRSSKGRDCMDRSKALANPVRNLDDGPACGQLPDHPARIVGMCCKETCCSKGKRHRICNGKVQHRMRSFVNRRKEMP